MNDKMKKRKVLIIEPDMDAPMTFKQRNRLRKRMSRFNSAKKRQQKLERLQEYVSVGQAKYVRLYIKIVRLEVQGRVIDMPRSQIMKDCPFEQNVYGEDELVVTRMVAEQLNLEYIEISTGDKK
jgi:hypothetical protein